MIRHIKDFFHNFNIYSLFGLALYTTITSTFLFFHFQYLDKIPESAKYEEVTTEVYTDPLIGSEGDTNKVYEIEKYNKYNSKSELYIMLPIFIGILFLLLKLYLLNRKVTKIGNIRTNFGSKKADTFKASNNFKYYKLPNLHTFIDYYLYGFAITGILFLPYLIWKMIIDLT